MSKLLLPVLISLIIGCGGAPMTGEKIKLPSLAEVPQEAWDKLAQKRIYFGHQSVGFNIVDGIKDIMNENNNIKLDIIETDTPEYNRPAFVHSRVGKNKDPNSKCDAFRDIVVKIIGEKADIAFMKFCYVDILEESDVQAIFNYYKKTMAELQTRYPELKIVHVTSPLRALPDGFVPRIKTQIKKLINQPIQTEEHNIKRNEFNRLLLQEYDGKQPIFDLAKAESTHPDGRREIFTKNGVSYYSLVSDYTHDRGHLNEKGRKMAAEQLLIYLAQMS